jgi:antitoxin component HigA of HigAB toxin-antitoxin module
MANKKDKNIEINFKNVKPIEFLRIIRLYGMNQKDYCELRGKTKCWWNNVLDKRNYLTYIDIKTLTDAIGIEIFNGLLDEVRQKKSQKSI